MALFALTACTPEQQAAMDAINDSRSSHGVPALMPSLHAMEKAQRWAEHLAANGRLEHSRLSHGMPDGWHLLAENVGRGSSIHAVHQSLMASSRHRANIVNPEFNWVGTGHATGADGTTYIVQVFARY